MGDKCCGICGSDHEGTDISHCAQCGQPCCDGCAEWCCGEDDEDGGDWFCVECISETIL